MYYDTYESGKRIQELRKAHDMTQAQLAEKLNISLDHMRKIENGQRGCSVDLLISVSMTFSVSLDFLVLGKSDDRTVQKNAIQSVIESLTTLKDAL